MCRWRQCASTLILVGFFGCARWAWYRGKHVIGSHQNQRYGRSPFAMCFRFLGAGCHSTLTKLYELFFPQLAHSVRPMCYSPALIWSQPLPFALYSCSATLLRWLSWLWRIFITATFRNRRRNKTWLGPSHSAKMCRLRVLPKCKYGLIRVLATISPIKFSTRLSPPNSLDGMDSDGL